MEGVLIAGRLSNAQGQERLLLWLDALDVESARQRLPEARWTMHGWYGSPTIAQLREAGVSGE